MKKHIIRIFSALVIAAALYFPVNAQNANRATSTVVVDALGQLPSNEPAKLAKIAEDLVKTGDEGLSILLDMLAKADDSLVQVEYAINCLVNEVSKPESDQAQKASVIAALGKMKGSCADETIKAFLVRQLMILGVNDADKNLTVSSALDAGTPQVSEKELLKVLTKGTRKDRFGALNTITAPDAYYAAIVKKLPKLKSEEAKADIIWWLGENRAESCIDAILPFIASSNADLRSEAAWAAVKIGGPKALAAVAGLLASKESTDVALAEECLKCFSGDVVSAIAPMAGALAPDAYASLINIFAQRHSVANKDLIYKELANSDKTVQTAAYKALVSVAEASDFDRVCKVLESAPEAFVEDAQAAVLASARAKHGDRVFDAVSSRKNGVAASAQKRYWPILISVADIDQALAICHEAGSDNDLFDKAFKAYINCEKGSKDTGEQRLIRYRAIMELARTDAQKNAVLAEVANTGTFLGIIFAGQYLEVPALQQAAAAAIRVNAIGHPQFNGPEVRALLARAAEVITGQDAPYEISAIKEHLEILSKQDEGFVSMFNGKDLSGWRGMLLDGNPYKTAKLKGKALAKATEEAQKNMSEHWIVNNGNIEFVGKGYDNLCTEKKYGDFEMYVDWYLYPEGPEADAGIYLRSTPQVQIWDTARVNVGAQVGSGGLYNNKVNVSIPKCVADNGLGQWNSFYIKMKGERVTVLLNGTLVVDNVIMENYWDRSLPILMKESIELQAHGSRVAYRNLYIRELEQVQPAELSPEEKAEGFELLFDGTSLMKWQGNKVDYFPEDGLLMVDSRSQGDGGDLYTVDEYSDFCFRFEFKLTKGANNGVGIHAPGYGDAAYEGIEIQILDHYDAIYQPWLKAYQYHGSAYGVIPAKNRDALNPVGEWNSEEIYMKGTYIRVTVNGQVVTEGDLAEASKDGTIDHLEHPGLKRTSGHIGFLGHGNKLWFRNIRVKKL